MGPDVGAEVGLVVGIDVVGPDVVPYVHVGTFARSQVSTDF